MSRVLAGTLLRPDGAPVGGARIYLTAKRNEVNNVIQGVDAFFLTNSDGTYSQSIVNGYYSVSVEYTLSSANSARRWGLGEISVESGASISLNELLQFSAPPDSGVAGQMQEWYEAVMAAVPVVEAAKVSAQNSATAAAGSAATASSAATSAAGSAGAASASASSASGSATTATNAATTATGAANTATTKAGEAGTSATNAQNSATAAAASAASVDGVVADAEAARDASITAKNEAQASAGNAASSATSASGSAAAAAGSAGDAAASASTASDAADTATDKAGEAQSSATAAAGSETAAAGSATAAAGSATDAAASASTASDAADIATDKAGEAQSSATAAAVSETAAAGSSAAAAGSATAAASSASTASDAADIATDKAGEAQSSATAAAGSEAAAAGSATAASDSASQAGDSAAEAASEAGAAVTARNDAEGFSTAAAGSASGAAGSATAAAGSATKAQNFANMDEDVPVPDSGGLYSAKHWAAKAEEAAGGFNLSSTLTGLVNQAGAPFSSSSTLLQALQAMANTGVGGVGDAIDISAFSTNAEFAAIPNGALCKFNGGSAAATYLNGVTAALPYVVSVGANGRYHFLVKVFGGLVGTAGNQRKHYFEHLFSGLPGNSAFSASGMGNLMLLDNNGVFTWSSFRFAANTEIPAPSSRYFSQGDSWVVGKDSAISTFDVKFYWSDSAPTGVSGRFVLGSGLSAGTSYNLFLDSVYSSASHPSPPFASIPVTVGPDTGPRCAAAFQVFDPLTSAVDGCAVEYSDTTVGSSHTVSMRLVNRGSSSLPAGTYIFNGSYARA